VKRICTTNIIGIQAGVHFKQTHTINLCKNNIKVFNKTEAAGCWCRLCFLRAFPFISLIVKKACTRKQQPASVLLKLFISGNE